MIEEIIILVITVLVLGIFLFLGDKMLGSRNVKFSGGYYLTAIITAIAIIVVIIVAGTVVGLLNFIPGIGNIVTILGFILASYIVKLILVKEVFERSVWVTMIVYLLVYVTNGLLGYLQAGFSIPYI